MPAHVVEATPIILYFFVIVIVYCYCFCYSNNTLSLWYDNHL